MKLLIITQKVDARDSNLGFFVRWIEEFAKHAEVTVITNEGNSRIMRFFRYQYLLLKHLPNADGVFFHMCPEYVLAAHILPKLFGKKTALWYVHKQVSWRLRLAEKFIDRIFTASRESCRLQSKKIEVVGHGIDTELFKSQGTRTGNLNLITAGRISSVKDLHTLVLGFIELRKRFPEAELSIAGEPITDSDRAYLEQLRRLTPHAHFLGGISHLELPRLLGEATAFLHASKTGSMDKAVLEALAAGLPVLTSSEAFSEAIPGIIMFREGDQKDLAEKIARIYERGEIGYNKAGREWVKIHHNLERLTGKIVDFFE